MRTSPGMRSRAGREVDLSAHESVASQRAAPRMTAAPAELAPTPPPREAPLAYRLTRRVTEYARLMRLDRPVGTWLLLWPALWALWIAGAGRPRPKVLGIFVLGVVVMRAAGCVINDFLDRNIDAYVQRTRDRPLAARRVAPGQALTLFALPLLAALCLVSRLDLFTVELASIGALLTVSYPLLKRFFPMPQLYLGISFGDRKSTRLNSSHTVISYAVFCLKKKNTS